MTKYDEIFFNSGLRTILVGAHRTLVAGVVWDYSPVIL